MIPPHHEAPWRNDMKRERSRKLYSKACDVIPGGVSSPVRAFKGVGGDPLFLQRAEGPFVFDADNNRYIDYVGSWGPLILGHAPGAVLEAIQRTARDGTSFGAATLKEVELAEKVSECVPSIDQIRFVNSGTEATMSALRLARGFTGRDLLIKFSGCYHGHADAFLSDAGSGVATLGIPGSAGVPAGAAKDTITLPYNNLGALEETLQEHGDKVAAIILEPVAGNMGMVLPQEGFLKGLRALCDQWGVLLIFDEVITGFRLGLGGAQEHFGIKPDLSTFGKIIGGGLPVGAYGGRADIMEKIAPTGPVYQAGTLSGNPLAMAAGLATLEQLSAPGFYEDLEARSASFARQLNDVLVARDNPAYLNRIGSIFYLWFNPQQAEGPRDYADIKRANSERFKRYFTSLLEQGIWPAPSAFEVGFISAAHTQSILDSTATAMGKALDVSLEG